MNYTYTYTTTSTDAAAVGGIIGLIMGLGAMVWLISMAIAILTIVAMWKVFQKAGREGWKAIVPFYNMYTLFEIVGMNPWMFLLLFVPIANVVVAIMCYLNLAKSFGKDTGFAIGLILLNTIFVCILAFGDAKYIGQPGAAQPAQPAQPVDPKQTPPTAA